MRIVHFVLAIEVNRRRIVRKLQIVEDLARPSIAGLPGVGRYLVQGALNRDYTLVLGMVILYSALLIAMGLLVDLLYAWLDPRVRFAR